MRTLQEYLEREGDSFDKLSPLATVIFERIKNAGLDPDYGSDSELDAVSTWEERVVVRLLNFYGTCSNAGNIYPHTYYGLNFVRELEAVGAESTLKALHELDELEESGVDMDDCDQVDKIEAQVPGDFIWADPILEFVKSNSDRFLQHGQ